MERTTPNILLLLGNDDLANTILGFVDTVDARFTEIVDVEDGPDDGVWEITVTRSATMKALACTSSWLNQIVHSRVTIKSMIETARCMANAKLGVEHGFYVKVERPKPLCHGLARIRGKILF